MYHMVCVEIALASSDTLPGTPLSRRRFMRRSLLTLPIAGLLLAACGGAPAAQAPTAVPATAAPTEVPATPTNAATATPEATPTAAAMNNEDIAEKLRPSTVLVLAQFAESPIQAEGLGGGTGIVYD